MPDVKDYATVIASALEEVSMNGTLQVSADGSKVVQHVGSANDDDIEVVVSVKQHTSGSAWKDVRS